MEEGRRRTGGGRLPAVVSCGLGELCDELVESWRKHRQLSQHRDSNAFPLKLLPAHKSTILIIHHPSSFKRKVTIRIEDDKSNLKLLYESGKNLCVWSSSNLSAARSMSPCTSWSGLLKFSTLKAYTVTHLMSKTRQHRSTSISDLKPLSCPSIVLKPCRRAYLSIPKREISVSRQAKWDWQRQRSKNQREKKKVNLRLPSMMNPTWRGTGPAAHTTPAITRSTRFILPQEEEVFEMRKWKEDKMAK